MSAGDTSPRQAIKDHPMLPTLLDPEGAHGPKWHSSIRQVARQSRPIGGEAIHQSSGTRGAGHARVTRVRVERDSSRVVGSYVVAREVLMRWGSCLGTLSAGFLRTVFDGLISYLILLESGLGGCRVLARSRGRAGAHRTSRLRRALSLARGWPRPRRPPPELTACTLVPPARPRLSPVPPRHLCAWHAALPLRANTRLTFWCD